MATVLDGVEKPVAGPANAWLGWWPVALGLLALYVPTFWNLGATIWQTEEQAHGPIVLAIVLWLLWQKRAALRFSPPGARGWENRSARSQPIVSNPVAAPPAVGSISASPNLGAGEAEREVDASDRTPAGTTGSPGTTEQEVDQPKRAPVSRGSAIVGWSGLIFGLLLYVLGRSQDILIFDVGSTIPVLAGVALIWGGWAALKALWFPLLFIVFMIPLPGILVDALTGPLKQNVSLLAEALLYAAGYPIGRSGVVLTIGQYQLLVADACSGLHSIFSLSALGLLYLYLMRYRSWALNGILAASILPIAFAANVVRVIILVLVTYHFGDEAGQGFVHGFAGIILFVVALLFLFALDSTIRVVAERLFRIKLA